MSTKKQPGRSRIPEAVRKRIVAGQEHRCLYCSFKIGSVIFRRNHGWFVSRPEYDHMIPFTWTQNNDLGNWALACNVCNRIKGSSLYPTLQEATLDILNGWAWRGYSLLWEPIAASDEDPMRWAVKFSTFLAGISADARLKRLDAEDEIFRDRWGESA